MQFYVTFSDVDVTLATANEWNKTKRYSRTYLNEDGNPCLELDLDLVGGVSKERILGFLTTCRASFQLWFVEVLQ